MITDKKLGLVVAENQEEALWFNVMEGCGKEISMLKARIRKAEQELEMSAREIEQKFKKGARAAIKAHKETIMIQREIKKLAESKLKRKSNRVTE